MNIGIIGYGSMGKMLAQKFLESGRASKDTLFISNRTKERLNEIAEKATVCDSNSDAAKNADILFVCVRPCDIKEVVTEINSSLKKDSLLVSLNGNITFAMLEKIAVRKIAKVIPSVTAEISRSQTLLCCNSLVLDSDKENLRKLLECMGEVIELPENEMGMGSELVSCMPGLIASMFDVVCQAAQKHTSIPKEQITRMVLKTVAATSNLMTEKQMSFQDVVSRVATKGGITEEGTKVIYNMFPKAAEEMFVRTLEKRRLTAQKAQESF
ncbi:MAG: NAD(P)-binding domain-containing protein [Treponema sp.]|nr:NAD(P)-binding domain-containing protein [Treponema sp.]